MTWQAYESSQQHSLARCVGTFFDTLPDLIRAVRSTKNRFIVDPQNRLALVCRELTWEIPTDAERQTYKESGRPWRKE